MASLAWGALSLPWQGLLPGASAWGLVAVEGQSLELGEGGLFQVEGEEVVGPVLAGEEVGVVVQNQEVVEVEGVQHQEVGEVEEVQNQEEVEGVQHQEEVEVEGVQNLTVEVVVVEVGEG